MVGWETHKTLNILAYTMCKELLKNKIQIVYMYLFGYSSLQTFQVYNVIFILQMMTVTHSQLLEEKGFKFTQSLFKAQTPTVFAEVSKIQILESLKVQLKEIRFYLKSHRKYFSYFELISKLRKWTGQEEIA